MAHGDGPEQKAVFEALLAALDAVDQDHAKLYTDVVLSVLPKAARDYLEDRMALTKPYQYQSDFARRYVAEGEAKGLAEGQAIGKALGQAIGEARAVLAVLDARGVEVPDKVRRDIASCTELDQLDIWVRRAVTATTVADLFDQR